MARCQREYDPTIGRFTALDPARDRRGDGDLYDYCMDDPVSRVDPTGLWSKENFDESKVSRDNQGQFAPTGSSSASVPGGKRAQAPSGELYAAAPTGTATDAGGQFVPLSREQTHERIGQCFGKEALEIYKEIESLEEARKNAATEPEKAKFGDKIGEAYGKLEGMFNYNTVFSRGFQDEQKLVAEGWKKKLIEPEIRKEFLARMAEIESTPPGQRAELVKEFYTRLAEVAGMPQTIIATSRFINYSVLGPLAGGHSDGQKVTMNMATYDRDSIDWMNEIGNFFHEQGHEWKDKMLWGDAATSHPKDLETLKRNQQNYVDVRVSSKMYRYNPVELHARKFEDIGFTVFTEWKKHR